MNKYLEKGTWTKMGLLKDFLYPVPERDYDEERDLITNHKKYSIENNLKVYS